MTFMVLQEERRRELKDIAAQMDTVPGRRLMLRILNQSGCLARPEPVMDPAEISYYEGKRALGFDLFADIRDAAPKKFLVMLLEGDEYSKELAARLQAEQEGVQVSEDGVDGVGK